MLKIYKEPIIQKIKEPFFSHNGVEVFIKREDLIHPFVSGNKWRKLKYNLEEATRLQHKTVLTFGGAFSNHIYATSAAANEVGFKSIGIIRGEELADKPLNKTLAFAKNQGMQLEFVSRENYRSKAEDNYIDQLRDIYGDFYLIPEGGTNNLAIKGCEEIVDEEVKQFDYLCLSVGTGGTISGVITAVDKDQIVIGFSALKGDFLIKEVADLLSNYTAAEHSNWHIETDYHFGGYAKTKPELNEFIEEFNSNHNFPIEPIYTGKMMFGLYDKIKKGDFRSGSKILAIHTGGLQRRE
ncbi:MAG TPA: pyridoxal-phosphate dependent enzyme [Fulvivirga sp.]|nr:pyridoxal-phosphate dependent enzyme [Fulvivirga sp.]